ncbi:transmembrane protein 14C [Sitophilus oryzae]|uniref:Transmembrane protein 14C n=1 Tax=Sitophilus oryzae TaxID=7048 RepID=A0A6J2Y223_SITOR|nr:transmembrane protein 14C [Sitophilus oryzae]
MTVDIFGYIYASAVAAGGIAGYAKAGSIPSLAAGLVFGSTLAFGAYQLSQDSSNYALQLGASSVLGGLMGYRFYNSRKIMPAGVVALLSVLNIGRLGLHALGNPHGHN